MEWEFVVIIVLIVLLIWTNSTREMFDTSPDPGLVYDSGVPGPCIGILTGVHGNEPAGAHTLQTLVESGYFAKIKRGSVRILHRANPIGLRFGIRGRILRGDLNRVFETPLTDIDGLTIAKFFSPCTLIIDFHEGWGFHQIQPDSLGSTVMANSTESQIVAQQLVHDLNTTPQMQRSDPRKLFLTLPYQMACDIPTTYSCYLRNLPAPKHHILVETSGQNDVQPLQIRQFQITTLINSLLRRTKVI